MKIAILLLTLMGFLQLTSTMLRANEQHIPRLILHLRSGGKIYIATPNHIYWGVLDFLSHMHTEPRTTIQIYDTYEVVLHSQNTLVAKLYDFNQFLINLNGRFYCYIVYEDSTVFEALLRRSDPTIDEFEINQIFVNLPNGTISSDNNIYRWYSGLLFPSTIVAFPSWVPRPHTTNTFLNID